jgi:hypothetical protein
MKRTVSPDRVPEPLEIYVEADSVKSDMVDVTEELSSAGYGDDFMYQVGSVAPPIEETQDIVERLSGNFAYVTVRGVGGEGVQDEQLPVDYRLRNTEKFREVTEEIDEMIGELGYDLDHWQIGSVSTSASSGSQVADKLQGMEIQATAAVDAGLDSQRGEMGFQPIRVGWFYKAPMNHQMQFGYRAFPNREFEHDNEKGYDDSGEDLLEDVLRRLTGARDDEVNMHGLEEEEVDVLRDLESEMQARGLL